MCSELSKFKFSKTGTGPIRFIGGVHWLDACVLVGCESWKTKARSQYTKQLGSQNGEDVNQLLLKFQSLRMRELWCISVFVLSL